MSPCHTSTVIVDVVILFISIFYSNSINHFNLRTCKINLLMEPAPKKVFDGDDNNDTLGIDSVLTFRATFYGL